MDLDGQREGQKPWQERRAKQVLQKANSNPLQPCTSEEALTSSPPWPLWPGVAESSSSGEYGLLAAKEMSMERAETHLRSNSKLVALQNPRSRPLSPGEWDTEDWPRNAASEPGAWATLQRGRPTQKSLRLQLQAP